MPSAEGMWPKDHYGSLLHLNTRRMQNLHPQLLVQLVITKRRGVTTLFRENILSRLLSSVE